MKLRGIFITIEGPDGAGKTSVIKELIPRLEKTLEQHILSTREPGGSRIAEKIRELILDPEHTEMDIRTEALLYAAGRRQHLTEKILPALERNEVVLCDRFVDSSLAYQGYARGIGMEEVASINRFATNDIEPDYTLYLDIEAEIGLDRIHKGKESRQFDRLDQEKLEFHEKVREGYLKLVDLNPKRITLIDANQELDRVVEVCYNTIIEKLTKDFTRD